MNFRVYIDSDINCVFIKMEGEIELTDIKEHVK
jgi:hypothetical protein